LKICVPLDFIFKNYIKQDHISEELLFFAKPALKQGRHGLNSVWIRFEAMLYVTVALIIIHPGTNPAHFHPDQILIVTLKVMQCSTRVAEDKNPLSPGQRGNLTIIKRVRENLSQEQQVLTNHKSM
jgi:hypothetical protein